MKETKTPANLRLMLAVLVLISLKANAQIYYQDFNPDVTIDTWSMRDVHIDSAATSVLSYGAPGNLTIWEEFGSQIVVNAFLDCNVMMGGSYPAALNLSQPIGSSGTWVQPNYAVLNNGSQGNWVGANDKYIGVRIKKGTQWLYGWIRMDVNTAGTSVTIKDYACNRTPDASINAGQTSSTSIKNGIDVEQYSVAVYPNPSNDKIFISIPVKQGINLTIYKITGETVLQSDLTDHSNEISISSLSGGLYILEIKGPDWITREKLIKE